MKTMESLSLSRQALPILLLLCLLYYIPGWFGGVSFYHDDSLYISSAHSLAEGRGYRLESVPGAPWQTKYPILFPALLAILWKIDPNYPDNTVLFRFVNTLLWLAALALTYRILVRYRYAAPGTALAVVALWGFSESAATSAGMVLSEALCTLMVAASVWYAEAAREAETDRQAVRAALLCGVFAGPAFLARSSVLLLWLAAVLALWPRSRTRAACIAVAALPFHVGWMAWSRMHPKVPFWDLRLHYLDYLGWTLAQFTLTPWPIGLLANVLDFAFFSLPGQTLYFQTHNLLQVPSSLLATYCLLGLLVTALMAWGGVILWKEGRPLLPLLVIGIIAPACVLPSPTGRYVVPVGGFILLLTLRGWQQCYAALGRGRRAPLLAATVLILAANIYNSADRVMARLQPPQPHVWQVAMEWVKENVPRDEGVLSEIDPLMYLHTGRQGLSDRNWMQITWHGFLPVWDGRVGYSPNPDALLAELRLLNVRWAVDVGDPTAAKGYGFPNILRARAQAFKLVYTTGRGGFHVYHLRE